MGLSYEGTYKIDGDKVIISCKFMGTDMIDTYVISDDYTSLSGNGNTYVKNNSSKEDETLNKAEINENKNNTPTTQKSTQKSETTKPLTEKPTKEPSPKSGTMKHTLIEVVQPKYDLVLPFSEGMAAFRIDYGYGTGSKHGFIDKAGNEIVPPIYDDVGDFSEGLAVVQIYTGSVKGETKYKYGFINKKGDEIVPLKYDGAGSFSNGLAAVIVDDKLGYIDYNGNEVIPLIYWSANNFSEGLAEAKLFFGKQDDGRYKFESYIIDKTGKTIAEINYYHGVRQFSEGLMVVADYDDNTEFIYGYIDKSGKEVIPCIYNEAGNFSEGLAPVSYEGKTGYINKSGKEIVPFKYDEAEEFVEELAAVCLNGKWGFINKTGKEVIALKYDNVGNFNNGMAMVELDDISSQKTKYGFIDNTGLEIIPLTPNDYDVLTILSDGMVPFRDNDNKWGVLSVAER